MNTHRIATLLATSALTLAACGVAGAQTTTGAPVQPADPQATGAPAPADDPAAKGEVEAADIVVTGTRVVGRSRLDTASPVDVLSAATLRQQGTTELGAALASVAPSIDFPRAAAVDGTDAIRPATLRGLSPDQTLVLVNGVRGHTSALLNINGSVGRGAAAVDLNTVPTVTLETIEVLRDGASAQYGSDAIAGVVNLRLREARSGGGAQVTYGFYDTDIDTARQSRHVIGENNVTVQAWKGIGFGGDGYLTLSGEYQRRQPTSRGDVDPRLANPVVDSRFGDPSVEQYTGWANAGVSITPDLKLYGWFGYQYRDSTSAAFPRIPTATAIPARAATATLPAIAAVPVAQLYPAYAAGFLPLINTHSKDINSAIGVKGNLGDWGIDANVSYGRNRIDFRTRNSANYTYGAASPTSFYDGALIYDQLIGGVDVTRKFDVFQSLNVAFGVEGRREGFEIKPGQTESYATSPTATGQQAVAQPGAQGFGGFQPGNATDRSRTNESIYADLEAQVTSGLLIGLAGRGEHYSDFGTTGTGKVSARYDFSPHFALRATGSTGFRAPALQQQYFTSTASVIVNNVPVLTGTYPSTSAVGAALGGRPLQPERSTNVSVGTVIRFGGFDLTVDGYRIHIRDQIGLSENIQATFSPQVAALLAGTGQQVSAARFFVNGIASTTKGIDAVAHYRLRSPGAGTFDFTVAGNLNHIDVDRVPTNTAANLNPAPTLFARSRILTLEQGTPGEKVTGTIDWSGGVLGATARVTYYGNVTQPGTTATILVNGVALTNDLQTGQRAIGDLELRYQPKSPLQLALGVSNITDSYPRRAPAYLNTTGVTAYPFYSPFGFNGRYLYVRAGLQF